MNGSPLGIVHISYSTHEEAKQCVAKENGRKVGTAGLGVSSKEGQEITVILDGQRIYLDAILKELAKPKKKDAVQRSSRPEPTSSTPLGLPAKISTPLSSSTPVRTPDAGRSIVRSGLPHIPSLPPRPMHPSLPMNPMLVAGASVPAAPVAEPESSFVDVSYHAKPMADPARRQVTAPVKSRKETDWKAAPMSSVARRSIHHDPDSSSATPDHHRRGRADEPPTRLSSRFRRSSSSYSRSRSRSRSPPRARYSITRRREETRVLHEDDLQAALAKNGKDYLEIHGEARLLSMVNENDVKEFFKDIEIESARLSICTANRAPLTKVF